MPAARRARSVAPVTSVLDEVEGDELLPEPQAAAPAAVADPLVVAAGAGGERLDRYLAQALPTVSRSRIQQWIEAGAVRVNGTMPRARDAVRAGDVIALDPPPAPQIAAYSAEPMPLSIVFEDEQLIVLDKPAGLVVHPAAGHWSGTLLNGLLAHDPALAQVARAGIVHRLDADTSGLMVVARTAQAQFDLVRQLQARTVVREYWAVAHGAVATAGSVDAALARDPRNPLRFAVSRAPTAKTARTHYRCVDQGQLGEFSLSWVACRLETGRTHQIRVHLESIGHPLVGDPVYRRGRPLLRLADAAVAPAAQFKRQALHACRLQLVHPVSGQPLHWFRGPPEDLQRLMTACGFSRFNRPREVFE